MHLVDLQAAFFNTWIIEKVFLVHIALGVLSYLTEASDKISMKFLGKDHDFVY